LIVLAGAGQTATVATAVSIDPLILLRDSSGSPRRNVMVRFQVNSNSGWVTVDSVTTDSIGRATTRWYLGPRPGQHVLQVSAAGHTTALAATARPLQPGDTLLGRNDYIEFRVGDLPIVVSAPHGGLLEPVEILDRQVGETARDANTDQLAIQKGAAFAETHGHRPHLIIVRLHRRKLDANREIGEGAAGNPFAQIAWREFHGFMEAARADVQTRFTNGLLVDLHGHGHTIQRLELGYLISAAELARSDSALNLLAAESSIRGLLQRRQLQLATLLRGPQSLGALLQQDSFPAVPSPDVPNPAGAPYFSGGFNTDRYGSRVGGGFDAVQIEANFTGVRDTPASRSRFAAALARTLDRFFTQFYTTLPH
jgi:N-formylglutamate amidohydrolase